MSTSETDKKDTKSINEFTFLSYTCCAPIGFTTSLVNGTTHYHLSNIPIGNKFHASPTDWNEKNTSSILDKHKYWKIYLLWVVLFGVGSNID